MELPVLDDDLIKSAEAWDDPSQLGPAFDRLRAYATQLQAAEATKAGGEAAEAESDHVIIVECPEGISAGDMLLVETEDGVEIEAQVPAGISVGQEFEVDVVKTLAEMKRKEGVAKQAKSPKKKKAQKRTAASPEESPADASDSGDQAGQVWMQRAATVDFEPLWMELSGTALSFKRKQGDPGFVRVASVESCSVLVPKTPRYGRPYAFRLDLASKDSIGDTRYVIAAEHFSDLQRWLMTLSDACVDGVDRTLKLLNDRGLDAVGGVDDSGE
eukprot:COSAG06_NODE_17531_length_936_cov_0.758662_1_plen_271_part_01